MISNLIVLLQNIIILIQLIVNTKIRFAILINSINVFYETYIELVQEKHRVYRIQSVHCYCKYKRSIPDKVSAKRSYSENRRMLIWKLD